MVAHAGVAARRSAATRPAASSAKRCSHPTCCRPIVDALTPPSPSPALARALAIAKSGQARRSARRRTGAAARKRASGPRSPGWRCSRVGDRSAAVQFQRALDQKARRPGRRSSCSAPRAPLQSRDPDAIAAWQAAIDRGRRRPRSRRSAARRATCGATIYASARRGARGSRQRRATAAWTRAVAAVRTSPTRREADAIAMLDAHLAAHPDDQRGAVAAAARAVRAVRRTAASLAAADPNASRSTRAPTSTPRAPTARSPTEWLQQRYFLSASAAAAPAAFPALFSE